VRRAVQSDAAARDIPVVVYSADFSNQTMRQAMALGAKEFLVKGTVGWSAVCDTIRRYAA